MRQPSVIMKRNYFSLCLVFRKSCYGPIMFSRDFYCTHPLCLPAYAKTLEGLSVVKLIKTLVSLKSSGKNRGNVFTNIVNILEHLYDSMQDIYQFTAIAKIKVDLSYGHFLVCREEIINVNLPSLVHFIKLNNVSELYFANTAHYLSELRGNRLILLPGRASTQCDRHPEINSDAINSEFLSSYTTTFSHFNIVPELKRKKNGFKNENCSTG